MKLEDLVPGQEYYTARDDIWATDQMGGRVRVLSLDVEDMNYNPNREPDLFVPCERLDPETGAVIKPYTMTGLGGFRGSWDPVGVGVMADIALRKEQVKAADVADLADAEAMRDQLMTLGIPSVIRKISGVSLIVLSPAQVERLIERGDA